MRNDRFDNFNSERDIPLLGTEPLKPLILQDLG